MKKGWVSFIVIIVILGIASVFYYLPYSDISIDVNPSIEFKSNIFGLVLSASGKNDDGSKIVDEIDMSNLTNKTIENAVSETVNRLADANYLDNNATLSIATYSINKNNATKLANKLKVTAENQITEENKNATVVAEAIGKARVEEARKLGVTPGKLNLVEKLIESAGTTNSIDKSAWLDKSVKDIMKQTNDYKDQGKAKASTTTTKKTNVLKTTTKKVQVTNTKNQNNH